MRLFALLLVFGLATPSFAQEARVKYWVFMADKIDVAAKAAPALEVTERAKVRRSRRASSVRGTPDVPVSKRYLRALEDLGAEPVLESRWLNAVSAWMTTEQARRVARLAFVSGVRPVGVLLAPEETAGVDAGSGPAFGPAPFGAAQRPGAPAQRLDYGLSFTQLDLIRAIPGLENGLSGAGVMLGIIDTGAGDLTQTSIAPIVNSGRLVGQRDFTGFPDDGSRHALAVLSIAAGFDPGELIGPAYGAQIILARTEYAPTETNQEEDSFVAGIEWMESQGVDVVNISLGYSEFDPGQHSYTYSDMDGDTAITTRAADFAASLGVTVVNSAGNAGNASWFFVTSPADGDSVITVGAVDRNSAVASFSGHGPTFDGRIKPNVSAMGVSVRFATRTAYSSGNGTSFSSPMVAAIAVQMLEVNPNLGPMDILQILQETTHESAEPNFQADNSRGHGVINAQAALAAAAVFIGTEDQVTPGLLSAVAYPNPSNGSATLRLDLESTSPAEIAVYDLIGRRVGLSTFGSLAAGTHLLEVPLPAGASGWYGYRITTGTASTFGSISVIR
ncbi:MAG: serine protease AprX [Rhodothermales bacterium]|jgi:serine protease AprX